MPMNSRNREHNLIAKIAKAVPAFIGTPWKQYRSIHDSKADVLYLKFAHSQHATNSELRDDGIVVHRSGNVIVGLTILEVSRR